MSNHVGVQRLHLQPWTTRTTFWTFCQIVVNLQRLSSGLLKPKDLLVMDLPIVFMSKNDQLIVQTEWFSSNNFGSNVWLDKKHRANNYINLPHKFWVSDFSARRAASWPPCNFFHLKRITLPDSTSKVLWGYGFSFVMFLYQQFSS